MNNQAKENEKPKKQYSDKTFIDSFDIMQLTGKSQKTAYRYLQTIKDFYNKKKHQAITYREFCDYFGL